MRTRCSRSISLRPTGLYVFERELASGGMSRIFVAEEIELGRRVVVKVLSGDIGAILSAERFA